MPDIFFLVEERSDRACEADRTSIFFWRQVNVRWCREICSSSKSEVRRSENFLVIFLSIFGHIDILDA